MREPQLPKARFGHRRSRSRAGKDPSGRGWGAGLGPGVGGSEGAERGGSGGGVLGGVDWGWPGDLAELGVGG